MAFEQVGQQINAALDAAQEKFIAGMDAMGDMLIGALDKMMNKATSATVAGLNKGGEMIASAGSAVSNSMPNLSSGTRKPGQGASIEGQQIARSKNQEIGTPPTTSISSPSMDGMLASANLSQDIQGESVSVASIGDLSAPAPNMAVQRDAQAHGIV